MVGRWRRACAGLCYGLRAEFCRLFYVWFRPFIEGQRVQREKFEAEGKFEGVHLELSGFETSLKKYEIGCVLTFFREQPHEVEFCFRSQQQIHPRQLAEGQQEEDGAGTAENRSRSG
jgi:hypothetical protein